MFKRLGRVGVVLAASLALVAGTASAAHADNDVGHFFVDDYYNGHTIQLWNDEPDLRNWRYDCDSFGDCLDMNDRITSFWVGAFNIKLYEHINYGGQWVFYQAWYTEPNIGILHGAWWNDRVSSIRKA